MVDLWGQGPDKSIVSKLLTAEITLSTGFSKPEKARITLLYHQNLYVFFFALPEPQNYKIQNNQKT